MYTYVYELHQGWRSCGDVELYLRWMPEQMRRRNDDTAVLRSTHAQCDERRDVFGAETGPPASFLRTVTSDLLVIVRYHLLADAFERIFAEGDEAAVLLAGTGRIYPGVIGLLEFWEEFLRPVDFLRVRQLVVVTQDTGGDDAPACSISQRYARGSHGRAYVRADWP